MELYINKRMTAKEICRELNVSQPLTIYKYLEIHGIARRNVNRERAKSTKMGYSDEEFKEYLINEYSNKSINQIAKNLSVCSSTVRNYLIKYNIPLISHKEANNKYNTGSKNPKWNGGRIKQSEGYILIYMPKHPHNINKYVYEHRYLVEKKVGRYLNSDEIVHHVDGNRSNNDINNLLLLSEYEHALLHRNGGNVFVKTSEIKKEGDN